MGERVHAKALIISCSLSSRLVSMLKGEDKWHHSRFKQNKLKWKKKNEIQYTSNKFKKKQNEKIEERQHWRDNVRIFQA